MVTEHETESLAPHENLRGAKLMQVIMRYVHCHEVLKYFNNNNQV